jgi:DNA processing protein
VLIEHAGENETIIAIERALHSQSQKDSSAAIIDCCTKDNIQIIPWGSPDYPAGLRTLYRPPLALFLKGKSPAPLAPYTHTAAVVGSRKADASGLQLTKELALLLTQHGITVVSGLAFGIDAAAHSGALESSLSAPTHAVLAHGHSFLYPRQHQALAARIIERGGTLITEYPPRHAPLPHQFIARNRIIAGLSSATIIVQATAKSGSLATARFALEQGREVLVLPGSLDDPRYEGSNRLLRDGATLITELPQVLEAFPDAAPLHQQSDHTAEALTPDEALVITHLTQHGTASVNDLRHLFSNARPESSPDLVLLQLELAAVIERRPGAMIALSPKGRGALRTAAPPTTGRDAAL